VLGFTKNIYIIYIITFSLISVTGIFRNGFNELCKLARDFSSSSNFLWIEFGNSSSPDIFYAKF